jgi:hypothetical protein
MCLALHPIKQEITSLNTQPQRKYLLSFALVALAALSACGPLSRPYNPQAPASSTRIKATPYVADDGTDAGAYTCTATQAIKPDFDWDLDGTSFYKVCTLKTDALSIAVKGQAPKSDTVCAFPAQYDDQAHVYARMVGSTGVPMVQCASISSGSAAFRFTGITYNALFVVESPDKTKMSNCLATSNSYLCPHYSFGKFR